MIAPFDIFKTEADGSLVWLGTAENLDTAKARVQSQGASKPGMYLIFSQTTGNTLAVEVDSRGELATGTTLSPV
jgi:hypothetical protein